MISKKSPRKNWYRENAEQRRKVAAAEAAAAVATTASYDGGDVTASTATSVSSTSLRKEQQTENEKNRKKIYQKLGSKEYEIVRIHGSHFVPPRNESTYVNVPHDSVKHRCVESAFPSGCRKTNPWWIPYAVLDLNHPDNASIKKGYGQSCNLCGKIVSVTPRGSPICLAKHIYHRHKDAYSIFVRHYGDIILEKGRFRYYANCNSNSNGNGNTMKGTTTTKAKKSANDIHKESKKLEREVKRLTKNEVSTQGQVKRLKEENDTLRKEVKRLKLAIKALTSD